MRYANGTKVLIKNNLGELAKNLFMIDWEGKIMTIKCWYEDINRYRMEEDKINNYCGSLWSEETFECVI